MQRNLDAIICLAAGHSQLPIIKAAQNKGFSVIAIDRNEQAVGLEIATEEIILSTLDIRAILTRLQSLTHKYNYCGVICRSSGPVLYTSAAIADEFNLPGLTKEITTLATEKSQLREFCLYSDINMVRGIKVKSKIVNTAGLSLPLIVKPDIPIIGKKNITVVWEDARMADAITMASSASGNGSVEIEEYVEGIDVSVLFHMNMGKSKVITYWDELNALNLDNTISGLGVSIPSVISGTIVQQKLDLITSILADSFNDVQALMILSVRIDIQGNIFVIELHADLGGDMIADVLLPTSCSSFDFFDTAVNASTGNGIVRGSHKFAPTALLYANKNVNIDRTSQVEKLMDQYILQSATVGDLHFQINSLWSVSGYHTLPMHNEWLNIWKKN